MRKDDYDEILWKKIKKFSFYYPLSQIWEVKPTVRNVVLVLWIISVLGIGFVVYVLLTNKLITADTLFLFIFTVVVVLVLLCIIAIIYILFDKCKFNAWIYSKWVGIGLEGRLYSELKWVKIFQYPENWNEYIKLIYTEFDSGITTETLLYDPKMGKFLHEMQKSFQNNWISCEKITDIKNIDISESIEYKHYFGLFKAFKMLSWKDKSKRIKRVGIIYLLVLFLLFFLTINSYKRSIENLKSGIPAFLIMSWILLVVVIIYFILSVKKFYARKENNRVYISYAWISDNYVLSKIKANYWVIAEWNVEWIMLTIDDGGKPRIYKRPKNEEVERFCNDLLIEIRKRKEW